MYLEYLFNPNEIVGVLKDFPNIRNKLGDPFEEGRETLSFPACRKTDREIYRILSNQHYQHLVELLKAIDHCIANGWKQPQLLRTRARTSFKPAVSEMLVAYSFINRNFNVRCLDYGKGNKPIPDILLESDDLSAIVEVYHPEDWLGMEYFFEELRLGILHLDEPYDFDFTIEASLINEFDQKHRFLWFNPWEFSKVYETPKARLKRIKPIISDFKKKISLFHEKKKIIIKSKDSLLNVCFSICLENIQISEGRIFNRPGFISPPTLSGYRPEDMFEKLLKGRILSKIKKAQTQSFGKNYIKILVIDISGLGYDELKFIHPLYLEKFGEIIRKYLNPEKIDIDMVIFCKPRSNMKKGDIFIPLFFKNKKISAEIFEKLFGSNSHYTAISEEIFIEKIQGN